MTRAEQRIDLAVARSIPISPLLCDN